jgi:hypothetical protein
MPLAYEAFRSPDLGCRVMVGYQRSPLSLGKWQYKLMRCGQEMMDQRVILNTAEIFLRALSHGIEGTKLQYVILASSFGGRVVLSLNKCMPKNNSDQVKSKEKSQDTVELVDSANKKLDELWNSYNNQELHIAYLLQHSKHREVSSGAYQMLTQTETGIDLIIYLLFDSSSFFDRDLLFYSTLHHRASPSRIKPSFNEDNIAHQQLQGILVTEVHLLLS